MSLIPCEITDSSAKTEDSFKVSVGKLRADCICLHCGQSYHCRQHGTEERVRRQILQYVFPMRTLLLSTAILRTSCTTLLPSRVLVRRCNGLRYWRIRPLRQVPTANRTVYRCDSLCARVTLSEISSDASRHHPCGRHICLPTNRAAESITAAPNEDVYPQIAIQMQTTSVVERATTQAASGLVPDP